ncbi:MAG: hypothetical protein AB1777_03425 [Bacteroidota bacterium]
MNNEEQVLTVLEEMASQIEEIKKTISKPSQTDDLQPFKDSINKVLDASNKIFMKFFETDTKFDDVIFALDRLKDISERKQKEIVHRVIEIKNSHWWIIGIASYIVISIFTISMLIYSMSNLKLQLKNSIDSDFKYRFLRVRSMDVNFIRKNYSNTTEFIYDIDSYYSNNKEKVQKYVLKREEEIKRFNEANAIAKQKELEAKRAREEAEKLKEKIDISD